MKKMKNLFFISGFVLTTLGCGEFTRLKLCAGFVPVPEWCPEESARQEKLNQKNRDEEEKKKKDLEDQRKQGDMAKRNYENRS